MKFLDGNVYRPAVNENRKSPNSNKGDSNGNQIVFDAFE